MVYQRGFFDERVFEYGSACQQCRYQETNRRDHPRDDSLTKRWGWNSISVRDVRALLKSA